jgi:hypothetical protein
LPPRLPHGSQDWGEKIAIHVFAVPHHILGHSLIVHQAR